MFLYSLAISIYVLLIRLMAFFNKKASLFVRGRKNTWTQLEGYVNNNHHPRIWVHCASLGEFEQGRPLIESLNQQFPQHQIVLTFFSPSGYEVRKNYEKAAHVCYLPVDTAANARKFIQLLQPKLAVFVKYEFWLHYLRELNATHTKTILVSAIFRPEQLFFKWYGKIFRDSLNSYNQIFVQNQTSARLLTTIGVQWFKVLGDTRFDRVWQIAQSPASITAMEQFVKGRKTILAGSTWREDEECLIPVFAELLKQEKNLALIIAPHEVEEHHLERLCKLLDQYGLSWQRHSEEKNMYSQVFLIDSVGILSTVYHYGKVVYVGGGFGGGIHNILEPLAFGLPTVFGPNYKNFQEAHDALQREIAFTCTTSDELNIIFQKLLGALENTQADFREKSLNYIRQGTGSTEKIMDYLHKEIKLTTSR